MRSPGISARQILTVVIIAVPWLMRDEIASRLDAKTDAAQQVQDALYHEETRATQAAEQRDNRARLMRIESLLKARGSGAEAAQAAEEEADAASVHAEGEDLQHSVWTFQQLLESTPVAPGLKEEHPNDDRKAVAAWIGETPVQGQRFTSEQLAKIVAKVTPIADAVARGDDKAWEVIQSDEWTTASTALALAYADLDAAAEHVKAQYQGWADIARWIAWVFTGLGTLMFTMGGAARRDGPAAP